MCMMYQEQLQRQLFALTEIAKTLTSPLELPELLKAVMEKIIGVIEPAQVGTVMIWDQAEGLFHPAATFGYEANALMDMALVKGESITGKVFNQGVGMLLRTPEQVAEAMSDMRPENRDAMARASGTNKLPICTLAAPILVRDQKYGVLVVETISGPAVFSEDDLPFLQTIADLIALAIDRDRLSAQAEAIRATRRTEQMRSEVLAALSHELRMPLTAIQGYASALLLNEIEWSDEKRQDFLARIETESQNMESLLRDILDSSMVNIDQLAIERQPLRIPVVTSDVASEVQRHTNLHNVIVDFPVDFPILEADPRWIKQLLRNLLDNAVKYSPEGGLIVVRGEARLNNVLISIADQGIGISPEDQSLLFERYFRIRSSSNLHIPGTGIGLPISRAIVEAHGGRIWIESKQGEGTTIYFTLPKAI
jgi:K+-sensing histidine kinase KdpD